MRTTAAKVTAALLVLLLCTVGCSAGSGVSATQTVATTTRTAAATTPISPSRLPTTSSTNAATPQRSVAATFVARSGRQLILDGKPFRFVGVNLYDAAASDRYSCNPGKRLTDAQLLDTLRYLHDQGGATVLRFWAYQTYTQGGTYFGGVDRVIAAAAKVGMKVLPVLEDGPGNCTTIDPASPKVKYQGDTWYSDGYKVPYGNATMSYRDYVKVLVAHYANEPTILAWSMMNEADTSARDQFDRPVLVDFATDIAARIRAVDSHHLITVGTQSNGAPGASGPDFAATGVTGVPTPARCPAEPAPLRRRPTPRPARKSELPLAAHLRWQRNWTSRCSSGRRGSSGEPSRREAFGRCNCAPRWTRLSVPARSGISSGASPPASPMATTS